MSNSVIETRKSKDFQNQVVLENRTYPRSVLKNQGLH
jgi:hypothetical protein